MDESVSISRSYEHHNIDMDGSVSIILLVDNKSTPMSIQDIKEKINRILPLDVAQTEWDNVGVLIDTGSTCRNILMTIDLSREVVEEAIDKGIRNIISYHPVIFKPLRNIQRNDVVCLLIANNINVFVPHTSWDPTINKYVYSLFNDGEFLNYSGPNDKSISEIVSLIKKKTGLSSLRVALSKFHSMDTVLPNMVVGAGSAFSYHNYEHSVIITGEMSHHVLLHSISRNNTVILLEHSNSERIALSHIKNILNDVLPEYNLYISESDKDPVSIINI